MASLIHGPASVASRLVGSGQAIVGAIACLAGALAAGAFMGFSDHWLGLFSAALSAVTFVLVFLLQYRENRDTAAIQIKLNELLRAVEGARETELADVEHREQQEQEDIANRLRRRVRESREERVPSTAPALKTVRSQTEFG